MKTGISVIIITYNGAHRISNVLQELIKQSHPADEVIVVIDGSKDNTREVVEKFSGQLPIKIVEIPNRGRSGARNEGVRHSEFDLILYLDDDTRPFTNCIREHLQHHSEKPGSIMVGHILEDPALFVSDIQQYRITLYERKGWTRKENGKQPLKEEEFFLASANLSVSRKTFDSLNGFNEIIRDTEDFDFGSRAMAMGIEIYYMEGYASAYHDDLINCKSFITRQRQYLKSLENIYKLNPPLYGKYLSALFTQPSHPKRMVYYFISTNLVVKMIDKEIFKYLLPKKIRYTMYDYIINGLVKVFPDRQLT